MSKKEIPPVMRLSLVDPSGHTPLERGRRASFASARSLSLLVAVVLTSGTGRLIAEPVGAADKAACLDPTIACFTDHTTLAALESGSGECMAPAVAHTGCNPAARLGLPALRMHEFRLNSHTGNQQNGVSIDLSPAGEGLAVWGSRRQEFGSYGVFAQRFDAAGRRLGPELHVNDYMPGQQSDPAVAWSGNDTAWAAWESIGQDGDRGGIYLRRLGRSGDAATAAFDAMGSEIRVNETTAGHQHDVAMAADPVTGQVLVTWTAMHETEAAGSVIKGRLFDGTTGTPLTSEVDLTSDLGVDLAAHRNARPIALGNGSGFVLSWDAQDAAGLPAGAHLRVVAFRAGGATDGADLALRMPLRLGAAATGMASIEPSIAASARDESGLPTMLAGWMEPRTDGPGYDVVAQAFRLDPATLALAPSGDPVDVDRSPVGPISDGLWRSGVAVAACEADGRFLVAWNRNGVKETSDPTRPERPWSTGDVVARVFDAHGRPLVGASEEPVVIHAARERQQRLEIASNGNRARWTREGVLALAWAGNTEDGDNSGIGLTLFTPENLAVADASDADLAAAGTAYAVDHATYLDQLAASGFGRPVFATDREAGDAEGTTAAGAGGRARARLAAGLKADDPALDALEAYPVWDPTWTPLVPQDYPDPAGPDFGFNGMWQNGWIPADPDIAAGPNHVVTVVNQDMAIYTKEGVRTYFENLVSFFRDLGAETFVFDPIAVFDVHSNRFVIAAAEGASTGSWINLAVSDDDDPNGTWHKYRLRANYADFLDFPNLGVDANAIYISADYFGTPGGQWIHIIDKAPLLNGEPAEITNAFETAGWQRSLGAVTTYDADAPAQYFATTYSSRSTRISLEAVRDPLGNPTRDVYEILVPQFNFPPDIPQLGTSNLADSVDWRIKHGVYRNGSLWLAHNHGENGVAKVRWYQIRMNGWPVSGLEPELVQSGNVDLGANIHTWFPDIGVDDEGNMAVTYNRGSANEYIGVWRSTRRVYDLPGRVRAAAPLQTSTSPEGGGRWGDYSGLDADPVNPGVFWSNTMFRVGGWQSWVGRVDSKQTMLLESGLLVAGEPANVICRGTALGGTVYLAYSFSGEGSTNVPSLGVTLDLADAKLAGSMTSDSSGVADFSQSLIIPRNAPRRLVWLQAFEFGNTSHIVLGQINR